MTSRRAVLAIGFAGSAVDRIAGPDSPADPGVPGDGPALLRGPSLWRGLPGRLDALHAAGWSASALLVARHPGAALPHVAPNEAVLDWLRTMLAAEHATRRVPRRVLTHDALLAGGAALLGGLGVALGWRDGPSLPDAEPDAPRTGSAYADVWCRHAWDALGLLARSATGRDDPAEAMLDRVRAQFDDACRLFGPGRHARLALPGVTLCAVDSSRVALTVRAMRHCAGLCDFDDTVLFTDAPADIPADRPGRVVQVPHVGSREAYSAFLLDGLVDHLRTDHVLIVQWDGFVVDPAAWDESFRRFDYIGARWPDFPDGHDVGNGGFSFRSRRLLAALRDPRLRPDPALLEDQQICRAWRPFLEREHGIVFAPSAVADRFAYERIWPGGPAFGFHGLFNLWRHLDDRALHAVVGLLPPDVLRGREFAELAVLCFADDRTALFQALAARWREAAGMEAVADAIRRMLADPGAADRCLRAAGLR